MEIGASEAEPIWTEFLRKLARRGLRGVKLVVSDAHEGIKAAVTRVLCATWQRCRVGMLNNACRMGTVRQSNMAVSSEMGSAGSLGSPIGVRVPTASHDGPNEREKRCGSRLRFTAAAVRKAWMRMFCNPRRTARASPCHVLASP
jgi:hypothetical protein